MGAKVGKIEQFNLVQRVLDMATKEGKPSRVIARLLNAEGYSLDQATVSRFLKKMRELAQPSVAEIVEKHVLESVPEDMDALEEMEAQCLARARELKGDFSHRLAALYIEEDLEKWCRLLDEARAAQADEAAGVKDGRMKVELVIASIMRQAIVYVSNDLALEKSRNAARRTALGVIDLKLKYSGILGGEGEGNIYFKDQEEAGGTEAAELRRSGKLTLGGDDAKDPG